MPVIASNAAAATIPILVMYSPKVKRDEEANTLLSEQFTLTYAKIAIG
jgi:hypothetical protein